MDRTSDIIVRVESDIKKEAELVLERLGIPMSNAINMFLEQIALQKEIPFEMKLRKEPVSYKSLTKEEFDAVIHEGLDDIKKGRVYSVQQVAEEMKKDFGI
ncbi:MAG: type II toxin-antitoxin system RelB/DinJ family antitoxin [Peptostreptococcaceae bacterium]|nr:type II toxin-antitoxin system RelB/DinJ family antitoxin [Peptostreptococcaceae bacterium]